MTENYGINDIESLSFRDGVRARIAMYLGSANMQGVYNAIQEIISNSIDEFYMGYGNKIEISITSDNMVTITDYGRGIPFGIKEDGSNVLVDIFSKAHTGGKFNNKVYNSVGGINGIGAKATCLSSSKFSVSTARDGKIAIAKFEKGELINYKEENCEPELHGTSIQFIPDQEVYNVETIKIDFDVLCQRCKDLSYLTKGLTFNLTYYDENEKETKATYCANNGLMDLIKDNTKDSLHSNPIYIKLKEEDNEVEVALMWTAKKEKFFTFTNGLYHSEGGTSLTGVKTAITNFMKKKIKGDTDSDFYRMGLVYAVSCKTPNPSFSNQTKSKINNPELRGLAQRATTQALQDFEKRYSDEFNKIVEYLTKMKKAEDAAEREKKRILEAGNEIEKNQKRKVFASDKLKDAEFLGENSTLVVCEGLSAGASLAVSRDITKYGILALRGKPLNVLSNSEEKIFENEEIKLLLSAMNIIPGKYDSKKLRYGKIAICSDADSDGYHIAILIMAALYYLAPQFIREGRLCWLKAPLYIVKNGKKEDYYFTDDEFEEAKPKGEINRAKGLGSLSAEQAKVSLFGEKQHLEILEPSDEAFELLELLMSSNVEPRTEFIFNRVDFSVVRE